VLDTLREVRTERLLEAAGELGIDEKAWEQLEVERLNLATRAQMGAFLLGMLVPMLTVIMLSVGCLNPAIDTLAGERERSTWETLLTTGVSRTSVVVAKYLYVATLGFVAGMINMVALSVSMKGILGAAAGEALSGISFRIPWGAVPVVAVASAFLALFIASGMMLFAVFARTFKEGQSMVMPFYLVSLLPALLVSSPDLELDVTWALVPVANIALMMREALGGNYPWGLFALCLAVEGACIALCLVVARWVMGFEEVLFGGVEGGPGSFLKNLWKSKRGAAPRGES
jgi:sodium transport system permease protein